jgi:hypothetical protein
MHRNKQLHLSASGLACSVIRTTPVPALFVVSRAWRESQIASAVAAASVYLTVPLACEISIGDLY